jgi:hypothetical protein
MEQMEGMTLVEVLLNAITDWSKPISVIEIESELSVLTFLFLGDRIMNNLLC